MEKLTKIEPFVENVSGTRSALWRVVCRRRTGPALCGTRHLQLSLPSPAPTFISNNHQQTIMTKYLWNLNIKCGSDGALNREVPFHLKRSGTCKRPGGIGPRASFDLIFVISWIICAKKLNLTTWNRGSVRQNDFVRVRIETEDTWHFLHWRRLILLFCFAKWLDWLQN